MVKNTKGGKGAVSWHANLQNFAKCNISLF